VDIRDRRGGAGRTGRRAAQVFFLTLMRSS
jgi:hypothetical protein